MKLLRLIAVAGTLGLTVACGDNGGSSATDGARAEDASVSATDAEDDAAPGDTGNDSDSSLAPPGDEDASQSDGAASVEPSEDGGSMDSGPQPQVDASSDSAPADDAGTSSDTGVADASSDSGDSNAEPTACATPNATGDVLLNLDATSNVYLSPSRVLGTSQHGWNLRNRSTGAVIARGIAEINAYQPPTINDQGFIFGRNDGGLEVHSASTGQLLAELPVATASNPAFGLAPDGSFVWVATSTGVQFYSLAGSLLGNKAGAYANLVGRIVAGNDGLRIIGGSAGATLVEFVTPAGQSSTSPAFTGVFGAWFADGQHFVTIAADTVRIYSKSSALEATRTVQYSSSVSMGGYGDYFWVWTNNAPVLVYRISDANAPALSVPKEMNALPYEANGFLSVPRLTDQTLLALHGSTPSSEVLPAYRSVAAGSGGELWATHLSAGALYYRASGQASTRMVACGDVERVIPLATGKWLVSVLGGQTLRIDPAQRSIDRVFPFVLYGLQSSVDGTILSGSTGTQLRVVSGSTGATLHAFDSTPPYSSCDLSENGSRLVWVECANGTCLFKLADTASGTVQDISPPDWLSAPTNVTSYRVKISPNGSRFAVLRPSWLGGADPADAVALYEDGVRVGSGIGLPTVWLDDARLLVNTYVFVRGNPVFSQANIVDPQGTVIAASPLPELYRPLRLAGGSQLYDDSRRGVFDAVSGAQLWSPPNSARATGGANAQFVLMAYEDASQLVAYTR